MSPLERKVCLVEAVLRHAARGVGPGPRGDAASGGLRLAFLVRYVPLAGFVSHRTIFDSHLRAP